HAATAGAGFRCAAPIGIALIAIAGCAAPDEGARYLGDRGFRRERLVASLVAPENGYSRARLERYATGGEGDWEALPEWNPRVAGGAVVAGLANRRLDCGGVVGGGWGAGRGGVAAALGEEPVAIPDLRPVSLQANLQAGGAVVSGSIELAIRIETLIITAHGG